MSIAIGIPKSSFAQVLARIILRIVGWRTQVILPHSPSFVVIGAPHTSNWDFFLMLLLIAAERLPIRFMAKDSVFRGFLGPVMKSLGGIPVNRRISTGLVEQIASKFKESSALIIGIAPEGTRKKTPYWKTGFYYIALQAKVPIVMGFLDYQNKVIGFGPSFTPTGDLQADFEIIKEFYSGIIGKNPRKQGAVELAP